MEIVLSSILELSTFAFSALIAAFNPVKPPVAIILTLSAFTSIEELPAANKALFSNVSILLKISITSDANTKWLSLTSSKVVFCIFCTSSKEISFSILLTTLKSPSVL
jgi:hypothetical protein